MHSRSERVLPPFLRWCLQCLLAGFDDSCDPMSGSADTSSCARVHQVSLFALEAFGFLRADGFAHDCLSVEPLDYKDPCPQAFEACLFQIEYKFNYFKQQALEDFCAQNNIQSASDLELLPGPKVAHAKTLEAEAKQEVHACLHDTSVCVCTYMCITHMISGGPQRRGCALLCRAANQLRPGVPTAARDDQQVSLG